MCFIRWRFFPAGQKGCTYYLLLLFALLGLREMMARGMDPAVYEIRGEIWDAIWSVTLGGGRGRMEGHYVE
jgi:hypothetical protein